MNKIGKGFSLAFAVLLAGLMCLAQAQVMTTGAGVNKAAWTPASLGAGLVAWYDATSGVYVDAGVTLATNGQTARQWNDRSGHGYNLLQATSGNRPTYQTGGFNSRQTVLFATATSKFMLTAANTVAMGTGNVGSAFGVGRAAGGGGNNGRIVSYYANAQTNDTTNSQSAAWIMVTQSSGAMSSYRAGFFANDAAFFSNTTDYRFGNVYDNTNNTNYLNNSAGTPVAAVGVAWNTPGTLALSTDNTGGGSFWDGPISEIIVTNTALDAFQRSFLDSYFRTKWGL